MTPAWTAAQLLVAELCRRGTREGHLASQQWEQVARPPPPPSACLAQASMGRAGGAHSYPLRLTTLQGEPQGPEPWT